MQNRVMDSALKEFPQLQLIVTGGMVGVYQVRLFQFICITIQFAGPHLESAY